MPAATQAERELHRRLVERDPTAPSELAELYVDEVLARLRRRLGATDELILWDAASIAVLNLGERPERYDPDRLGMVAYLVMDASGDARNAIAREHRRRVHITTFDVELLPHSRNLEVDGPEVQVFGEDGFEPPNGVTAEEALMELTSALPDERDRQTLLLIQEGERRTPVFAWLYGLEELNEVEQRRRVKQIKDRVLKTRDRVRQRLLARAAANRRGAHDAAP